jgi:hypothetical protein
MLILSMNDNEPITLYSEDGSVLGKIHVSQVNGDRVRLGFEMREDVAIARSGVSKEIALKLLHKNKEKHA